MLGLPRGAEWIVILIIVLLLFGPGRIGKIAGELGKGIKSFRDGLSNSDDENKDTKTDSNGNIEPKEIKGLPQGSLLYWIFFTRPGVSKWL